MRSLALLMGVAMLGTACGDKTVGHHASSSATTATSAAETSSTSPSSTVPPPTTTAAPTTTTTRAPARPGTWRVIPPAPGTAQGAPVWTGQEFVAWGGGFFTAVNTGIAYRLSTGQWRRLADSPLAPRFAHSAVWTGEEILYWGGVAKDEGPARSDGAAYNPTSDTWRMLPAAPIGGRALHASAWTGREMVVWGGMDQCCPIDSVLHDVQAAAYNPASNRWRRLADVPAPWSGDDGSAITGADVGHLWIWRHDHLGELDFATNKWTDLGSPPPGDALRCMSTAGPVNAGAFTPTRLVVWTGGCGAQDGLAFDLRTKQWTTLARAPRDGLSSLVLTPDVWAVLAGADVKLARYDEPTRTRKEIAPPQQVGAGAFAVWTGTEVLLWGGGRDGHDVRTGATYRP